MKIFYLIKVVQEKCDGKVYYDMNLEELSSDKR